MTSNTPIYSNFRPTYLYIKQHTVTGLLYFGKTTRNHDEMLKYTGSGKYWCDHINKHGTEHVDTIWYCLFYDKESISEFAPMCSTLWNIVESDEWLNLKEETGLDGGGNEHLIGVPRPLEIRKKISKGLKGKNCGEDNHNFGKHHSEESNKKRSNTLTGRKHTEERIENMRKGMLGRINSDESNKKRSIANSGFVTVFNLETKEFGRVSKDIFDKYKNIKYVSANTNLAKSYKNIS